MILVQKGDTFTMMRNLCDGKADKFIQAKMYDNSGTQIGNYAIPHMSEGMYLKNDIVASVVGVYLIKYVVYRDAGFQQESKRYEQSSDMYRVEDIIENLTDVIDLSDGSIT